MNLQPIFQRLNDQPVIVCWDGNDLQAMVGKDSQGQEVGGLFDKNNISRSGIDCAEQVQCTGCTGSNEQAGRFHHVAISFAEEFGQCLAEINIALLCAVLQESRVIPFETNHGCPAQSIKRQE